MKKVFFLSSLLALLLAATASAQLVDISAPDNIATEGGTDTATFEILLDDEGNADITLDVAIVAAGTGASPSDYILNPPLAGLVIPSGAPGITITVTATEDAAAESDEDLRLEIRPGPGYVVGPNNQASITIPANDFGVTNTGDFSANATPAEREGTLRQAIENSNSFGSNSAIITFADFPFHNGPPQTIATGDELSITAGVEIQGPGADQLTVTNVQDERILQLSDPDDAVTATIIGIHFAGGDALDSGPDGSGGGIYSGSQDGTGGLELTLRECAFTGNRAVAGGGVAFASDDGILTIERCLFEGNSASLEGGALAFSDGLELRITDSTFANNGSADRAGGLMLATGTVSIVHPTIAGNHSDLDAGDAGGGLFLEPGVECLSHNTIIAGNTRGISIPEPDEISGSLDPLSRHNLIGDPTSAGGLVDGTLGNLVGTEDPGNPGLRIPFPLEQILETVPGDVSSPLVNHHGGPTRAIRPVSGSPAIEQGDQGVVMSEFDQRGDGFPRVVDAFPDLGLVDGGAPDIGAIEFAPILVTTTTDEDDGTTDPGVGDGTSLREAINMANFYPGNDLILFSRGFNNTADFFDPGAPKVIRPNVQFDVHGSLEIRGPGADLLTLDGDVDLSGTSNPGDTRLFTFQDLFLEAQEPSCTVSGLTLANGNQWSQGNLEDGGGIHNGVSLLITDTVIRNCSATSGGGIFNTGTLNLFRTEIHDNSASDAGGGIFADDLIDGGNTTVQGSTIARNSASHGGGLSIGGGSWQVVNSTISQNDASDGGGIFYENGSARIVNSTIAENTAGNSTSGGGIHFSGFVTSPALEIDNTIVAGNTALGAFPADIAGGQIPQGSVNNLIGDAASSGGLIDSVDGNIVGEGGTGTIAFNTILEPLADNGGLTPTYFPAPGSPALDAGDDSSASFNSGTLLATDQRDEPRFLGPAVDIGSVESEGDPLTLDPINDQFVSELDLLEFTASATDESGIGGNILFSLEDGASGSVPGGADIDPLSGSFSWQTQEEDGPGFYQFDVVATLEDDPAITARQTVFVDVFEINANPTLGPINNQTVTAGDTVSFTATASDPDIPENDLSFSLDSASENLGMQIDAQTGEFLWTPNTPGPFTVTVTVSDNADPELTSSRTFNILVNPGSSPIVSLSSVGFVHEPNSFSQAPPSSLPPADIVVDRGTTFGDLTVNLRIDDASLAAYNADFTVSLIGPSVNTPILFSGDPLEATVTIPDGASAANLRVEVIDDPAAEADEPLILSLLAGPGYDVGSTDEVQPVIAQNDYVVTNGQDFDPIADPDAGEGTLRQAVINAKAGLIMASASPERANISFTSSVPAEIILSNGPLLLDTTGFNIRGPGSDELSLSAAGSSRVLIAYDPSTPGNTFAIYNLDISGGFTSGSGGGIFNSETLRLEGCTITNCIANHGGGITNEGTLILQDSAVRDNFAAVYGGGIDNFGGDLFVGTSTVAGNSANFGGGIESSAGATLSIQDSTISGNDASFSGGGIDCFTGSATLVNTTISGNSAGYGGGLFNEQADVTISQSTIANNSASSSSGGLLCSSNVPAGNTLLYNSIVAGNPGGDIGSGDPAFVEVDPASNSNLIADADNSGGLTDGTAGNLVGMSGSGVLPIDSIIAPLADNAGPTLTHALVEDGPAVDRGNNLFAKLPPFDDAAPALSFDQRGPVFDRVFNSTVDIGAFEWAPEIMRALACELSDGPAATITWRSTPGEQYDVLCSTDLKNWVTIATHVPATGDVTGYTDENPPAGQAYFIIRKSKAGSGIAP